MRGEETNMETNKKREQLLMEKQTGVPAKKADLRKKI